MSEIRARQNMGWDGMPLIYIWTTATNAAEGNAIADPKKERVSVVANILGGRRECLSITWQISTRPISGWNFALPPHLALRPSDP